MRYSQPIFVERPNSGYLRLLRLRGCGLTVVAGLSRGLGLARIRSNLRFQGAQSRNRDTNPTQGDFPV